MIKVYHFETSLRNLAWHKIYCDLAEYYKNTYNAEIVYLKSIVSQEGQSLYCPELNYNLKDTDFVVYDSEKDIIKVITWNESNIRCNTGVSLTEALELRNNPNDILLVSHTSQFFYDPIEKKLNIPQRFNFKVKDTTWYPFKSKLSFDEVYENRKNLQLVDKLFWRSSTKRLDPFTLSELGICNDNIAKFSSMEEYIKDASQYKIGLAISSVAEKCYREIEYMAIGLPFIRLEFIGQHNPPLIPNFHYIAISREEFNIKPEIWSCDMDRTGGPEYVEAYKNKFLEVKDNKEFLNFISENARNYFKENCDDSIRITKLIELLEEK
tara:strand:+ start:657 stop:1628 length:972 start_codon:yes stop_codon:yes gene_type:complete